MTEKDIPSVKDLASSEPKLRTAAFKTIQDDLKSRESLTNTQGLQLWKGLFYMLYLTPSHPPLPHQRTIISVAALTSISNTPSEKALLPLDAAFWETMVREWHSIDVHRMDKYLLLIRMVLRNTFENILTTANDKAAVSQELTNILSIWPLATPEQADSNFSKVPEGLRYHILDCWVDEIEATVNKINADEADEEDKPKVDAGLIESLIKPISDLSVGKGVSKGIKKRAKETVADERWDGFKGTN